MTSESAEVHADLLIEILCEELPASYIAPALAAFEEGLLKLLSGLDHGAVRAFSTPRRLAVCVEKLAAARPRDERLMTGPALSVARRDGEWTRAAEGFARGKGATAEELEVVEGPKGPVIAVRVSTGGETVGELLAAGLDRLVMGLPFRKSMTWREGARWARPVRRLVAVYGGAVLDVSVAGLAAGGEVLGHRRSRLLPAPVRDAASYLAALEARWVLADRAAREARMREQLAAAAEAAGVELDLDRAGGGEALVQEVVDLVEWPRVVTGRFDDSLLELPPRLLVESMRVHQRTFPTWRGGALTSAVLIVSNAPEGDAALIADGNARVLAARFYDAKFFYAEDRKLTLEQHGEGLAKMRWVKGLGNMDARQERIAALGEALAGRLGADAGATGRAGRLCKCDLLTQMVGEFPELQGHMGRLYAAHQGEPEAVAAAIEEHYLPRFSGDALPASAEGRALALADRLDTLVGCFGMGMKPKGSADPQGLRRAAGGVVAILLDTGERHSLGALFDAAAAGFAGADLALTGAALRAELVDFTAGRLRAALRDAGHATDVVDAVLAVGDPAERDPVQIRARVEAIGRAASAGEFQDLMGTFKRVLNITRDQDLAAVSFDSGLLTGPEERALVAAYEGCVSEQGSNVFARLDALDVDGALAEMSALKGPVDVFFDAVLVMDPDPALRAARLGLLSSIARLFLSVADFRRISSEL